MSKWLVRIICSLVILLLIIGGLSFWLKPAPFDFQSSFHPFKSAQAKRDYLDLYDKRARAWPVKSSTLLLTTSQGQTFVRVSGPETAEPLVLLHGAGGNSLQWMPNITSLSKRYRVYAIDTMFGHGRSVPNRLFADANDYVNWLDEVLQHLSPAQKVNLVGLSYGGWISAQYVKAFPERLNKVVLLAPAGVVAPLSTEFIVRAISVAIPFKFFVQQFLRWLAQDTYMGSDVQQKLIEDQIDEAYLAVRSFKSNLLVYPNVFTDQSLGDLVVPIFFLVGQNEKIYSPSIVLERLHKVAPQIKTELVNGAGHDLSMVKAKQVNQAILIFLHQPNSDN